VTVEFSAGTGPATGLFRQELAVSVRLAICSCDWFNADGKQLAEATSPARMKERSPINFNQAGTYRLFVEETDRGGKPGFRLSREVEPFIPVLSSASRPNKVEAASDGSFEIKSPPPAVNMTVHYPVRWRLATISFLGKQRHCEKKTEVSLTVKSPCRVEAGQMFHFTIVGQAEWTKTPTRKDGQHDGGAAKVVAAAAVSARRSWMADRVGNQPRASKSEEKAGEGTE